MTPEGAGDHEFLIDLLIYSNKLPYSQLITVLVYWNSPPESHEQSYLNVLAKPLTNTCEWIHF